MQDKLSKDFVYVKVSENRFDLAHPREYQVRYLFVFPHLTREEELGMQKSYLLRTDEAFEVDDDDTALDVSYELRDIYNSYLLNTNKMVKIDI